MEWTNTEFNQSILTSTSLFIVDLEISVLVNNVGLSYEFPAPYLEIEGGTNEKASELIKCNITSVNTMTALVLPQVHKSYIHF